MQSQREANKTLVEFKLASNSQLSHLEHQTTAYQKAHRTDKTIKVIIYYTEDELEKVNSILRRLGLEKDKSVVLIDARNDNKESASKIRVNKAN